MSKQERMFDEVQKHAEAHGWVLRTGIEPRLAYKGKAQLSFQRSLGGETGYVSVQVQIGPRGATWGEYQVHLTEGRILRGMGNSYALVVLWLRNGVWGVK